MVWYTRLVPKLAAAATSSPLFKKLTTQKHPTLSKLGATSSSSVFKKLISTQNHPISSTLSKQKHSFSNHLVGYKSPPPLIISSKYGQYYPNNVFMVKRYSTYARRDLPEWLRKILVYKYTHIYYLCAVLTLPAATWIICTGRYETIPYTNRTHFLMLPPRADKVIAKNNFNKDELAVLPEEHPDSVRVKSIGDQIVKALETDLAEAMNNNNKGHNKELSVDHLKDMEWEFVVAYDTGSTSFSVPGGKICVSADMLNHLKSDADIATVIGHEVGHIVARHYPAAAALNMYLLFNCVVTVGAAVVLFSEEKPTLGWKLGYTGSPRDEMEADYIGLLIMASAGFDPQEAPKVYALLDQLPSSTERVFYQMHPSGKKRAEYLAKAKVMEEAKSIYSKTIESRKMKDIKDC